MQVFILGATGLVGKQTFNQALQKNWDVITVTRRQLEGGKNIVEPDTDKWPEIIATDAKGCQSYISGFGTTRAKAGGMEGFKKIDYGVNYALAKAAKEAGVETCVLVSSGGALLSSYFPYLAVKGKLEDDIIDLGFKRTVVLRPGALVGDREQSHGWGNDFVMALGRWTHNTPLNFLTYGIPGEDVARVAVDQAANAKDGVTIIGPGDLIKKANSLRGD